MAAKSKAPPPAAAANPLASPAGTAWLAEQFQQAAVEVKRGPNGEGWRHNESKRPATEERAEFLRALLKLLP